MREIEKLKIVPIIIIQILILSYFISNVSAIDDQQIIIGHIFFEDGLTVDSGVSINIQNNNSGEKVTTATASDGKYQAIIDSNDNDVIWVNVSYYGNTGGKSFTVDLDNYPLKRCDVTISGNIFPVANFSFTPNEPNEGQNVQFNCLSVDSENNTDINRVWVFGDGSNSNQKNPAHTFSQDGTYDVTLTVFDYYGAPDSVTKQITVQQSSSGNGDNPPANQPPNALIDLPEYGYETQLISFDSTQSYDSDGVISLYNWSFGDGNYSNQPNTQHAYNKNGTYEVTLEVIDNQGVSDSESVFITIYNQDSSCNKTISNDNKISIEQNYNIQLNESFYLEDFNCDSIYDIFNDPNDKLEIFSTINIEDDKVFLISLSKNDIPDFIWNPEKEQIFFINYTKPVGSNTDIDYEKNQIFYKINITKNNWSYIEITDLYPKYDFFIKNSKNESLNNDRIKQKNNKIFIIDNRSDSYTIAYNYSILQPTFSIENNSKFNTSKPSININYSESVEIVEAKLNNNFVNLSTIDNKSFIFKSNKDLFNGLYNLSVTVKDLEGNFLTSVISFDVHSNFLNASKSNKDKKISSSYDLTLLVVLIVIFAVIVFIVFKKFWKKQK